MLSCVVAEWIAMDLLIKLFDGVFRMRTSTRFSAV